MYFSKKNSNLSETKNIFVMLADFFTFSWIVAIRSRKVIYMISFNPFIPNAPFLYPFKTWENHKVFWWFQGVVKGGIGNEWVITWYHKNEITSLHCHGITEKEYFMKWQVLDRNFDIYCRKIIEQTYVLGNFHYFDVFIWLRLGELPLSILRRHQSYLKF